MPHYQNGQLARVGDIVKGKGYNLKDEEGQLREIVGQVVGIIPHADACNIRVAVLEARPLLFNDDAIEGQCYPDVPYPYIHQHGQTALNLAVVIEYGQCDHFLPILSVAPPQFAEPAATEPGNIEG